MPDKRDPRKGFESAKARWLELPAPIALALVFTDRFLRDAGGDWNRILHAMPFAIAACAATAGAIVLIDLGVRRLSGRRRPERTGPGFDWVRWLQMALSIECGLVLFAGLSLRPPGSLTWNWTPVVSPPADWKPMLAFIVVFLGFVFLVRWWLGFVERDRARAAERDRLGQLR